MKTLKFFTLMLITGSVMTFMPSCSKSDSDMAAGDSSSEHKVNIQATQFDPVNITVLPGSKITWTNMDSQPHSIVSDDSTSFNSGNIAAGGTFSITPAVNGIYGYHCGVHPAVQGTVYVVTR